MHENIAKIPLKLTLVFWIWIYNMQKLIVIASIAIFNQENLNLELRAHFYKHFSNFSEFLSKKRQTKLFLKAIKDSQSLKAQNMKYFFFHLAAI